MTHTTMPTMMTRRFVKNDSSWGRLSFRRMTSKRMRALACGLLWLVAASAQATYKVEITAPKELRALLVDHLDLVRYQERDDLSDEQFKYLVATVGEQVRQLTATEGYFLPNAVATVREQNGARVVQLKVDPRERTMVSAVALALNGAAAADQPSPIVSLRESWRLPVGSPFRQADWDAAKNSALQGLQKRRYAAARIQHSEARIEPARHDAELAVQFDSGPAFTFGELQISGTKRYPESIVRNVNPLLPDEEYSTERLLELQRQILSTPYFSNVVIDIANEGVSDVEGGSGGTADAAAQTVRAPIKVRVTEFPTQRIRAGAGYATDTGAHVEGRYSHNNVFDRAWVFDGQAKLEQRRQFGSLELAMPPDQKAYVNSIHTSLERTTLQGADVRSLRLGAQRARTLEKYDTALTLEYYRDELRQINGVPLPDQTVAPGKHQALVPGYSWTRRDVDNLVFPRRGSVLSAQAGFAVRGVLTDQTFVRLYGRVRHYLPLASGDLIILRSELGALLTKGSSAEVPASLLFRAGGTDSIRGYSYQSIGNLQNGTVYPTKYMVTAGAEYQHWFSAQWGAAVFYDVGTATDNWTNKTAFQGVGAGARWRSPVGPVNLDLAYGVHDRQIRPHVSLGVAF